MIGSLIAQPTLEFNSSSSQEAYSPFKSSKDKKGEHILTWLVNEALLGGIGANGGGTCAVFMEYTPADLLDFEGYKIDSITHVHFYIYVKGGTNNARILIMQGATLATATEVVSQNVPVSSLGDRKWHTVALNETYYYDGTQNIYIGYEVTTPSTGGSPVGVGDGVNPKQAWYIIKGGEPKNYVTSDGQAVSFLIRATGKTGDLPAVDIALSNTNFIEHVILQESVTIQGAVKNVGQNNITSFKCKYLVGGVFSTEEEITGVNIAPGSSYTFSHPVPYVATTSGNIPIQVIVSDPNGITDRIENNSRTSTLRVYPYSENVQRKVLLEGFTSSTCGPCVAGNTNLKAILTAVPDSKWTCIKYQMSWPGSGDPYYTAEGGVRGTYYGITGVPHLVAGGTDGIMTTNYTANALNAAAAIPSPFKMTGIATVWPEKQSVYIDIETTSISTGTFSNLRLFAAIVEKATTRNAKSNGETSFNYVMKKFLTSPNGDAFSIAPGETKKIEYGYYFYGNYRLPASASSAINHSIEHSVEDFNNLMVVYWVQNMTTKEVIQSGTSECVLDINETEVNNIKLNVYPNPASELINVVAEASMVKATLFNVLGQAVKEVNMNGATECQISVNNVPQGIYLLKVDTDKGSTVKRVQIL